jgi:molecular chaperone DnaK
VETKAAIEGGDPEAMKEKSNALAQVAMKLGQAIYEQEQASGAGVDAATSEEAPTDDNVVDAEFSEVDEDKKD